MKTLSIIIPVYNEVATVKAVIERSIKQELPAGLDREILVIDDGSSDGGTEIIKLMRNETVKMYRHNNNRGKGAAVRTGLRHANGDILIIHDADLEYSTEEWPGLLAPILSEEADVVYGSRFLGRSHRVLYFWHYLGNKFITLWSNAWTNLNLTDMETGAKLFRREVIQNMSLKSNRFGFEPEFTAKVAHSGWKIYEVGINYHGRSYRQGKKITWRDGVAALWHIMKWNIVALIIRLRH